MSAAGVRGPAVTQTSGLRQFGENVFAGAFTVLRAPRSRARRPAWPPRGRLLLGALLAMGLVVGAMLLADAWSLGNVRSVPAAVAFFFGYVTDLGLSGWFLFPLAFALLAIAALNQPSLSGLDRGVLAALAARLGFVFSAIAAPGLVVAIVKRLIGRARPFVDGHDSWAYAMLSWRADYASMPSGHTTTAFAAAVAIGALCPQARLLMWTYAVLVGVSRVVVSAHHPSDVLAGAIVGTVGALLVRHWFANRRLAFAVDSSGRVYPHAGPSWRRIKSVAHRLVSA